MMRLRLIALILILCVSLTTNLSPAHAGVTIYTWVDEDLHLYWDAPLVNTTTGLSNCAINWNGYGWSNDGGISPDPPHLPLPILCAYNNRYTAVEIWRKSIAPGGPDGGTVILPSGSYDSRYTSVISVQTNIDGRRKYIRLWLNSAGTGQSYDSPDFNSSLVSITIPNYRLTDFRIRVVADSLDPMVISRIDQQETFIDPTATPIPTNTIPPTRTPAPPTPTYAPTTTPNPSITASFIPPTLIPTYTLAPTQAPSLAVSPPPPAATVDTCNTANLATPCKPLPIWPTLDLPLISLPSPTPISIRPTPTVREVTMTPTVPAPTITPTPASGGSVTPHGTPIQVIVNGPQLDISGINSLSGFARDTIATFIPLANQQVSIDGTPTGLNALFQKIGAGMAAPIVFLRQATNSDLNSGFGFINTLLLFLLFMGFMRITSFFMPMIIFLIRIILQIVNAIKPI